MKLQIIVTLITVALSIPPFYHTSVDIQQEYQKMAQKCPQMKISSLGNHPNMDLITFNEDKNLKMKGFLIFGEHSRELISPEAGLKLLQTLCSPNEANAHRDQVMEDYELRMILNVNPISREKVEEGSYCLRENENGIDLNRNYKAHWNEVHDDRLKHVNPGPFAFSERETQIVSNELMKAKPDVFMSIHSGTLGLYSSYGWTDQLAVENQVNYLKVLDEVQAHHCPQCKVGSCGKQVGYLAPGTSMDYAYDELKIRYSYTFEIYNQDVDLSQNNVAKSFLQRQDSNKNEQINQAARQAQLDEILRSHSCFAELQTTELTDEQCLGFFNPLEDNQYNYYVENWSNAILRSLKIVSDIEKSKK